MKTKQLGYLFAVFATFIAADAFAFDVTPTPFTGDEGTQRTLSIKVGADDWEPIIESNLCSGFEYQFRISLITTGDATWASNQFSGDINLAPRSRFAFHTHFRWEEPQGSGDTALPGECNGKYY